MGRRRIPIFLAAALAIVPVMSIAACGEEEPATQGSIETPVVAAPTSAGTVAAMPTARPPTASQARPATPQAPTPVPAQPVTAPQTPRATPAQTPPPTEPPAATTATAPDPVSTPSSALLAYAAEHAYGPGAIFVGDGTQLLGPPPHESMMLGAPEAIYRQGSAAAVLGLPLAGIPDHLFIFNSDSRLCTIKRHRTACRSSCGTRGAGFLSIRARARTA